MLGSKLNKNIELFNLFMEDKCKKEPHRVPSRLTRLFIGYILYNNNVLIGVYNILKHH